MAELRPNPLFPSGRPFQAPACSHPSPAHRRRPALIDRPSAKRQDAYNWPRRLRRSLALSRGRRMHRTSDSLRQGCSPQPTIPPHLHQECATALRISRSRPRSGLRHAAVPRTDNVRKTSSGKIHSDTQSGMDAPGFARTPSRRRSTWSCSCCRTSRATCRETRGSPCAAPRPSPSPP